MTKYRYQILNYFVYVGITIYICREIYNGDKHCYNYRQGIKGMNKNITKPKLQTKISTTKTLMAMSVGETIRIDTKDIRTATIRMSASRLEKGRRAKFFVTEQNLINETQITRLK